MSNQNQKNSNTAKSGTSRKLIIGLLVLCLMGGLTIYAVNRAITNTSADVSYENQSEDPADADLTVPASIPVTDSLEQDASDDGKSSGSEDGTSDAGTAGIMPVQGEITKMYSGENLVYSKTLDQYLCHKAVDISAPAGSPVASVMAGTVTDVGTDDRYGSYVTITHGNGLETKYCCLGESEISEGDVVNKGDRIGSIGEDALFEKADGPHLHFEVRKDGKLINPDEVTK